MCRKVRSPTSFVLNYFIYRVPASFAKVSSENDPILLEINPLWIFRILIVFHKSFVFFLTFQMAKMKWLALNLFQVLICRFNYSCRHTDRHRIIWDIFGNYCSCPNHNIIANCYPGQNNNIIANVYVVSNHNWFCYFQIWYLVSIKERATIMGNKLGAICNVNIISQRNQPWLCIPAYSSIDV